MRVLWLLASMHFRAEMEYRVAFVLDRLAQILAYGAAYAAIWVVLSRFDTLGGWVWPELALLLSFQLLAYALGAAFSFTQFRGFEDLVRQGTFDALLVKPVSPWAYITFSGLNVGYIGHVVLAAGLMAWSLAALPLDWSLSRVAFLAGSLVSSAVLVAAIMTAIGASALIMVQSRYLYTVFFGFWELARYPITLYPAALQGVMMTILPTAFMNYVPVAVLLGKEVPVVGEAAAVLTLAAGPLSALAAAAFWRAALVRYQGAGG